jgi:hypothetical protein
VNLVRIIKMGKALTNLLPIMRIYVAVVLRAKREKKNTRKRIKLVEMLTRIINSIENVQLNNWLVKLNTDLIVTTIYQHQPW